MRSFLVDFSTLNFSLFSFFILLEPVQFSPFFPSQPKQKGMAGHLVMAAAMKGIGQWAQRR
jgi:hypothetical protein